MGCTITPQLDAIGLIVSESTRPVAQDRPAAVALVGGEAQHVDEIGEGAQREAAGKDEADRQARRRVPLLRLVGSDAAFHWALICMLSHAVTLR